MTGQQTAGILAEALLKHARPIRHRLPDHLKSALGLERGHSDDRPWDSPIVSVKIPVAEFPAVVADSWQLAGWNIGGKMLKTNNQIKVPVTNACDKTPVNVYIWSSDDDLSTCIWLCECSPHTNLSSVGCAKPHENQAAHPCKHKSGSWFPTCQNTQSMSVQHLQDCSAQCQLSVQFLHSLHWHPRLGRHYTHTHINAYSCQMIICCIYPSSGTGLSKEQAESIRLFPARG